MVSANQFYGMLRDENLRLVYAKQEKEFIDEGISKNRIFSRFYLAYLGSSIIVTAILYLVTYNKLAIISVTVGCLANGFILLLLLGPFIEAASDYRKFLKFREEHDHFLAGYGRKPLVLEAPPPPDERTRTRPVWETISISITILVLGTIIYVIAQGLTQFAKQNAARNNVFFTQEVSKNRPADPVKPTKHLKGKIDPFFELRQFKKGTEYWAAGKYGNALTVFESIISENPESPLGSFGAGITHMETGEHLAALSWFNKALSQATLDKRLTITIYGWRAATHWRTGHDQKALNDLKIYFDRADAMIIKQNQTYLAKRGYYEGPISGTLTTQYRDAVNRWVRAE